MTRDASFWRWYVEANDDLRHNLVERPWYGREVTGDAAQDHLPNPSPGEQNSDISPSEAPDAEGIHQGVDMQELYGQAQEPEAPAPEPPQMEQE